MSKNMVILTGNVGNEPKFKEFTNGRAGSFSLATEEKYKGQNGEDIKKTEWHNIVAKNQQADIVEKYVQKGDKIMVIGKLRYREWENKEGVKQYITEVVTDSIELFWNKKKEQNGNVDKANYYPTREQRAEKTQAEIFSAPEDDLPY